MANLEVSLAPPTIGHIGPIAVTNTMFSALTISFILIVLALILRRKLNIVPGRLQVIIELLVNFIMSKMTMIFGSEEKARKYFPLLFTIFIFLLFSNYFTLIPFVESVIIGDGIHLFTTPTAHYSLTITLAVIMIVTSHVMALMVSPLRHIGNFIKIGPLIKGIKNKSGQEIGMAFIDIFLGFMDIIGEIAKLISVSTRLFGNMFAGGVIIGVISAISFYTQFVAPLPFIILGLLTGFVQAFVFTMLGMIFISSLTGAVEPAQVQEPIKIQ